MSGKKLVLGVCGILLFTTITAVAEPCGTALGNTTIEKATLQCLDLTGKGTFNMATILGKLTIMGSMNATKSTFNNLDVTGNVMLEKVTVGGASTITGMLNATDATFQGDLILNSQSVNLVSSTTKNITVKSDRDHETTNFILTNSVD